MDTDKAEKDRNKYNFHSISYYRELLFGIATIWLMLFHSVNIDFSKSPRLPDGIAETLNIIKCSGSIGVDIFLILSGVGLYYSFSKNRNIRSFYIRRAKRILPTALICSTLWFGISNISGLKAYLINVNLGGVFVYGELYFWYLSLIVLLYLIYPLLWKLFEKTGKPLLTGTGIIIIWTVILIVIRDTQFFSRSQIALTRVPAFIIGCAMAKIISEGKKCSRLILVIAAILLIPMVWSYGTSLNNQLILYRYTGTICALFVVILFSGLFEIRQPHKAVCSVLDTIGKYSLEIYLLYTATAMLCTDLFNVSSSTGIAYYIPVAVLTFILAIGLKAVSSKIVALLEIAAERY